MIMTNKDCDRVFNILTCKNLDGKTISINLDRIDYWVEDNDPALTEIHLKNLNYSLWIKVDEKTFRKNYLEYKERYDK